SDPAGAGPTDSAAGPVDGGPAGGGNGSGPHGSGSNGSGPNGSNGAGSNGHGTAVGSPWSAPEWSPRPPEPAPGAAAPAAPGAALTYPAPPAEPVARPEGPGAYAPGGPGPYPPGPPPPGPHPWELYPPGGYPPGGYPANAFPPGPYPGALPPGPPPAGPAATRPAGRARGPFPVRTHRWGLGAYVLVEAVFLLTSVLVGWAVLGDVPMVGSLIIALAVPTVLAAGTAVLITVLRGNGPRIDLHLQWSWRDVGLGLAFGLGGLAVTIPASLVYVSIVGQDASSAVGDVFGSIRTGPVLAVVVLVIVVFLAPLCEEIVYRGLLWGGVERLANRWVAFAVTTLLFAMAHFEFTRTPLLLVVAIPIAVARLYSDRLLPSIVAHQVNNLLPGVVLMLGLLGVMPAG
ncbi:CPBP family intramembrane glutamic endopeptidase, partial [Pseudonocardia xinjiangensis]|uniref:CPBP family intramembrane glutamic endopeptidase n=1 Tax=Pseudonocardia xinjiangensis TaxID=75289 RepID=UPI001B7CE86C